MVIDITNGLTEYCNRVGLKSVMSRFGEVDACWIPPVWDRSREAAYVKFKSAEAADAALQAMGQSGVRMHGVALEGRYRVGGLDKGSGRGGGGRGADIRPATGGYRDARNRSRSRGGRRSPARGRDRRRDSRSRSRSRADGKRGNYNGYMRSRRSRSRRRSREKRRNRSEDRKRSRSRSHSSPRRTTTGTGTGPQPLPIGNSAGRSQLVRITVDQLLPPNDSLGLRLDGTRVHDFESDLAIKFGWRVGDEIVNINGASVGNIESLLEEFSKAKKQLPDTPVVFGIIRNEQTQQQTQQMEGANAARQLLSGTT